MKIALLALLVTGSVGVALPSPTRAQQSTQDSGEQTLSAKRKINLAGRQRMLTQYMAKGSCFVSLGVDEKAQINEVFAVHDLFDSTLADLRKGNTELKLLPETDPAVLAGLEAVQSEWKLYSRAVTQGDLKLVIALNVVVLDTMNSVVGQIEKTYGGSGKLAPELAAAINIAGRQRMLSQRASKEHCLIAADQDAAANRKNLLATIDLFETSLEALLRGSASLGLKPAPAKVAEAIEAGKIEWFKMKPVLERAAKGGKPSVEDAAAIAKLNIPVLEAMEDVVALYEGLDG